MNFQHARRTLNSCNVGLSANSRILDFGCGSGSFVKEGRAAGYEVYGCDFSAVGDNISAVETPYRLPYPDEFFEVVVSNTVMEHVMNYDEVLAELRRVLKPKGAFLHSFPARWTPIELHTFVPLATVLRAQWWLTLWAAVGVRNSFQTGSAPAEVALKNYVYLREHTNYLTSSSLMRYFRKYFSEVRFVEREFLRNSPNPRGQVLSELSAIPFIPHLYRTCWNRVLFGRR
jgi:ubiquinone/menaquinone biosynthesis C-methylase UbiE